MKGERRNPKKVSYGVEKAGSNVKGEVPGA